MIEIDNRVMFSPKGNEMFPRTKYRNGVVTSYAVSEKCIRVLRDGEKHARTYHESFWQLERPFAP